MWEHPRSPLKECICPVTQCTVRLTQKHHGLRPTGHLEEADSLKASAGLAGAQGVVRGKKTVTPLPVLEADIWVQPVPKIPTEQGGG